jgi:hypothetical protein
MPNKKVVPVRFYAETDKDLIEWLEGLATGQGNDTIKAMLRAGIAAAQSGNSSVTHSASCASIATLDPASSGCLGVFPRIREIMDTSLAVPTLHELVVKLLRRMKIQLLPIY